MNTIHLHQNNNLCSGCGTCVAICPVNCIEMKDNDFGEFRPHLAGRCISCGNCLKVCPFNPENLGEDEISKTLFEKIERIQHLPQCGFFLDSYIGYSNAHRFTSASGGLATWFLEYLLVNKIVDAVACVGRGISKDSLLEYKIVENVKDLRSCSGSAYYAVEMSQILQKIKESKKRYAIVGLPCFIKAIRLASNYDKVLKENISFAVGLVCGHLPAKALVDFVAMGANKSANICNIKFRVKDAECKQSNYNVEYTYSDNTKIKYFFVNDLGLAHGNKLFTQRSCEFCDDIFAECADVVFMDAWLPEYEHDTNISGMSMVITRSKIAKLIFDKAVIDIIPISITKVIESQTRVGVVQYKRKALYIRVFLAKLFGMSVPNKRIVKPQFLEIPSLFLETLFLDIARKKLRLEWNLVKEHPAYYAQLKKSVLLRMRIGWLLSGRYLSNAIRKLNMQQRWDLLKRISIIKLVYFLLNIKVK